MRPRLRRGASLLLAVGLVACVGQEVPQRTRYALAVSREGPAASLGAGNLRMGRIVVAPRFERNAFVYQTDEAPPETFDDDQTTFVNTSDEVILPR